MTSHKYPTHMRAAVLWKTGKPLSIEDNIQIPPLKPGQILIKILYSGVCRSQLMEVMGNRGTDKFLPHLLGHEGSGKVVEIGKGVSKVSRGDWVILGWIKAKGKNVPGAKYKLGRHCINSGPVTTFSTYTIVSENRVVLLPRNLPKDIAVLFGCALPTGAGIVFNEVKPKAGSSIAIVGLGGIGLSALMATRFFQCKQVIAIDVSPKKLALAKQFGATHLINSSNANVKQSIYKITNFQGVDYRIDAGGMTHTIEVAFDILNANSGKCIFASHPPQGQCISLDPFHLISGKTIAGSWGGKSRPDKDIPMLANLYLKGLLPLQTLFTKTYSLDQINLALDDLKNNNVFRPLIVMDENANENK